MRKVGTKSMHSLIARQVDQATRKDQGTYGSASVSPNYGERVLDLQPASPDLGRYKTQTQKKTPNANSRAPIDAQIVNKPPLTKPVVPSSKKK